MSSINNDLVSHPKLPIDGDCTEIVKIKIEPGQLQTKLTTEMIPVNPEKHTLKDLKCLISKVFNVPTYRIKKMEVEDGISLYN